MEIKNGQPRDHEIHNPTSIVAQEQRNTSTPNKEPASSSVVDNVRTRQKDGTSKVR